MQLTNAPTKIPLPFATNGAYNTIPESASSTPGLASLSTGFPAITMEPVASGGIPPAGQDFNGILLLLSAISRWANAGAGFVYDNTFATDTNVGGYPQGARVLRSDGLGYWFNTVDNNQVNPETSATAAIAAGWVPDFTTGAAAITMTNTNVTLTPLQYGHPIIIITGALAANLQLIFPTGVADSWVVINQTTGSYTITAKTSGGTGVTVSGVSQIVGDGTNIYNASNASALQKSNNLSDLASLATALTNLSFIGSTSYLTVPNPSRPANPWIIQYLAVTPSTANGAVTSLPITFPAGVLGAVISDSGSGADAWGITVISNSSVQTWARNYNGGGWNFPSGSVAFTAIVIGY